MKRSALAAALLLAIPSPTFAQPVPAATQASALDAAVRLADWQLGRMGGSGVSRVTSETRKPRAWEQAVFWVGMTALADAGAPPRIRQAILDMGRANAWTPGEKPYFADDHAITQSYLWSARNGAGPAARLPTKRVFDQVVGKPAAVSLAFYVPPEGYGAAECLTRWCWCDALFMAPAAFIELSRQTGDRRYADFALREFWATTAFLYDPAERLYYRDSRFFERRDAKGRKEFWSRGNGWVFGGMARIIPLLPKGSPDRRRMEALFRDMAERIKALQKPDGYWAPSLLAPEGSPPETSGTAFYTYGLAWGINAGLLPSREYEPVVRRGWSALGRAIQPDGRLGFVQQVSDRPEKVEATDTQYYGVGAFLLAATQMAALDKRSR
ncbi:glycoside hydrolase family 105 protein [Sphingomonas sp. Root241]|uniref:glycoside hydrolase family 88/105 protein n=1 Tax=Sphingomonas sp. Root241 TaxID=1736501 RepID=UPI0006FE5FE7|nr:glycoside hydrolase family 88 protein [Sphingomonas sp. Root241]KRC78912.1 glycosyl hydrolase family 88 [Sphingomonas sp. Root241]